MQFIFLCLGDLQWNSITASYLVNFVLFISTTKPVTQTMRKIQKFSRYLRRKYNNTTSCPMGTAHTQILSSESCSYIYHDNGYSTCVAIVFFVFFVRNIQNYVLVLGFMQKN